MLSCSEWSELVFHDVVIVTARVSCTARGDDFLLIPAILSDAIGITPG